MCTGPQSVLYEHIRFEMTWTDYRYHRYCVILETRVRMCVFLGLSQLISENSTELQQQTMNTERPQPQVLYFCTWSWIVSLTTVAFSFSSSSSMRCLCMCCSLLLNFFSSSATRFSMRSKKRCKILIHILKKQKSQMYTHQNAKFNF